MTKTSYPPLYMSWIVWGLGALFYFAGFYQRVAPAVMTDQLMSDFQIGAAALGNLSAFYFYSYVAMQIPTGMLADVWGPRKLLASGSLIAAVGSFIFAAAPSILWANVGRLLIGGSVAVAYVALLKLATHWFPPRMYATVSGLALFCGVLGAVSAGVPLRLLVSGYGWRPVMLAAAFITLAVCAANWLFVRDDPRQKGYASYFLGGDASNPGRAGVLKTISSVFGYKNTWLISLCPSGVVGPVLAFSGLWGVPFFTTHYGLSQSESAAFTSVLLVSWAVGGPVLGALSDKIGRRKPLYIAGCVAASACWGVILFRENLPLWLLTTLLAVVGFSSGVMIIGFAFVRESVPPEYAGTASGVCNMGIMIGPMILQPLMGWALDRNWAGAMVNGARIYDLSAYHSAFLILIIWSLVSIFLIAFTKETHCDQMAK